MLGTAFKFLINNISRVVSFLFTIVINESPKITLGEFLLACAILGLILYFLFGTDFIPGFSVNLNRSKEPVNYKPRHAKGNTGQDYSTRVSRHEYKK